MKRATFTSVIGSRAARAVFAAALALGVFALGGCRGGDQIALVNDAQVTVEVAESSVPAGVGGGGGGGATKTGTVWTLGPGGAATVTRETTDASCTGRVTRYSVRTLPTGTPRWFELPAIGSYLIRFSGAGATGEDLAIKIEERSGPAQRDAQDRQVREIIDRPTTFEPARR